MSATDKQGGAENTPQKRARKRRLAVAAMMGALAIAFFAWALAPRPIEVDTALIERGDLSVTVVEEGRTRVREMYTLSAPLAGRLERVIVEPGDTVIGGETVLARLRPSAPGFRDRRTQAELENSVAAAIAAREAAVADVARADAEFVEAAASFDRDRRLLAQGNIAQARMDRTRAARDAARAARDASRSLLRAREAEVARAEAALIEPVSGEEDTLASCCIELRAPINGVVLHLHRESEAVLPSGTPILDIGDPTDLEIYAEILSVDAVNVNANDRVRIDGWGGPSLVGHVSKIEPAAFTKVSALGIEEQRVNVVIDVDSPVETWGGLGHQFRVDVHIETWHGQNLVVAPDPALFRRGGHWALFVIENGRALERIVKRGEANGQAAEIQEGLAPGDEVVLYPPDDLRNGSRVTRRRIAS